VKTKSTKKALTEKAITVVTMFMPIPPAPPFESDIAPASQNRHGRPSAQQSKRLIRALLPPLDREINSLISTAIRTYLDVDFLGLACKDNVLSTLHPAPPFKGN